MLEALQILKEKEARLKSNNSALLAKRSSKGKEKNQPQRQLSSDSESEKRRSRCYIYGGKHHVPSCPDLEAAKEISRKRRNKRSRSRNEREINQLLERLKQLKAFPATEKESAQEDIATKSQEDSSEEEDVEEVAAVSKSVTSKLSKDI